MDRLVLCLTQLTMRKLISHYKGKHLNGTAKICYVHEGETIFIAMRPMPSQVLRHPLKIGVSSPKTQGTVLQKKAFGFFCRILLGDVLKGTKVQEWEIKVSGTCSHFFLKHLLACRAYGKHSALKFDLDVYQEYPVAADFLDTKGRR